MKEIPKFQAGYTSDKYVDEYGRRFCIRLLRWSDGRYSIAIGLATKIQGSTKPSKFSRYILIPVRFLDDIGQYAPLFVDSARKKMAKNREKEKKIENEGFSYG